MNNFLFIFLIYSISAECPMNMINCLNFKNNFEHRDVRERKMFKKKKEETR